MAVLCPRCRRQYDVTLFQFGSTVECDCGARFGLSGEETVKIPVEGVLDLHTFRPSEVGDLVPEYIRACREKGILRLRIIHGKGTGVLMRTVRSILQKSPEVESFKPADMDEGGWGATIVRIKALPREKNRQARKSDDR